MSAIADPRPQSIEAPLTDMRRGETGRVARVVGETADAVRLRALGICEGGQLEVLRTGEAWIVRVLGSRVGLSRSLAASVLLTAA